MFLNVFEAERTTEKDRTRFKTMKKYTWFVERETERDSDARKRKRDEARENDRERQITTEKYKRFVDSMCQRRRGFEARVENGR